MSTDDPLAPVEKRVAPYLLPEPLIEAVRAEARRRRCWPNRVIEDLIRDHLRVPAERATQSA